MMWGQVLQSQHSFSVFLLSFCELNSCFLLSLKLSKTAEDAHVHWFCIFFKFNLILNRSTVLHIKKY